MVSTQRKPVSQITDKDVKMTRRPDLNPLSTFFDISYATPKAILKYALQELLTKTPV